MSSVPAAVARPVLADRLAGTWLRDAAAVGAGVLVTAAAAQVVVPLPFSPVPLSGQTFAVLLVAAALGPARAVAAMGLYLLLGGLGLPFYADAASGWQHLAGASGGYLLGFVVAAVVVGALARRGADRRPATMAAAFLLGSAVIYLFGATVLALVTGMGAGEAVLRGVAPYLVGDVLKAALAAALLPGAWYLLGRDERRS
ncbi:MAG: biotin transporter BioY [Egibacteraceae bacterium]